MSAFCCWSGGKESSLSYYRATRDGKIEVRCLLNMVNENGRHSRTHGVSSALLQAQSEAIGIPLIQQKTSWKQYEREFKKVVRGFKNKGVELGIFGDIDLEEHRDWVERVCNETGIEVILPLWKGKREDLLKEFICAGFKAVIVATNASFLGKDWLGREINKRFIEDLKALGGLDICGERGEYHTFVYDGPIFKKSIDFTTGKKVLKDKHWFLNLELK